MKKLLLFSITALLGFSTSGFALTRTSIANGNWNNPSIWSPTGVPLPTDDIIIINSQVSFNQNIAHANQEFRVNQGASLISSGQDTITLGCQFVRIDGYVQTAVAFFSASDSVANYGTIVAIELQQAGTFINNTSGVLCVTTGIFTSDQMINNGSIACDSWLNSGTASGSGKYCITGIFINSASITGNGDICDASPSGLGDMNLGTIAGTITNCQTTPCAACTQPNSIQENSIDNSLITLSPNPVNGRATITLNGDLVNDAVIEIVSVHGQLIKSVPVTATQTELSTFEMEAGIYICRLIVKDQTSAVLKFVVQ
ncbi:MAG: T9SS type A sorting domain-containing protein [Bacteroidetes bacterium]|nr:T9SS type A sorting domain-containing protein [Bacteroidota bacterium]